MVEIESTQSVANLENSERQREGLPYGDKKGSFKGLEKDHSGRKVRSKLTDCKVQPKGQVQYGE